MGGELVKNAVGSEVVLGPFVDKTDGVTAEISITAPSAARIWKNGITSTIDLGDVTRSPNWTHDGDGWYTFGTLASDVDTLGRLVIEITDAATHLPVWDEFAVVTALTSITVVPATISNPVISSTVIELDQGNTYDGTSREKLSWTVTKDYSAATAVTLEIWRTGDAGARTSMKSQAAVVASATTINIADFDAGVWLDDLVLDGCPAFEQLQFALIATWSGNYETIAKGNVYVFGSETP